MYVSFRLLKKMRKKSKRQIENERKEQGFSIYVSGANAGKQRHHTSSRHEERTESPEPETERQRVKTAGGIHQSWSIKINQCYLLGPPSAGTL